MKKFSETNNNSNMDDILQRVSFHTGLSIEELKAIINDKLIVDTTTGPDYIKEIENYFIRNNEMMTVADFRDSFAKNLDDTRNKPQSVNKLIKTLGDNYNTIDTYTAMTVIKDILISADGSDGDKLKTLISVTDQNFDVVKLNESSDFNFDNEQVDYGSLKNILSKGNNRWRVSNDIESNYVKIMNYIDSKIDNSNNDIVEFDNTFQLKLLKEYISGSVNPININYSSNKHMIANIQSFLFDSMLVINGYVNKNGNYLDHIKESKVTLYNESTNKLISLIYSSLFESKIVNKHFIDDVKNGKFDGANEYGNDNKLVDELTNTIVGVDVNRIRFASVTMLLQFLHSSSFDFNLKIRPLLKVYINNTLEIAQSFNKIKTHLKNKNNHSY